MTDTNIKHEKLLMKKNENQNSRLVNRDKDKVLLEKIQMPGPGFHPIMPPLLNAVYKLTSIILYEYINIKKWYGQLIFKILTINLCCPDRLSGHSE